MRADNHLTLTCADLSLDPEELDTASTEAVNNMKIGRARALPSNLRDVYGAMLAIAERRALSVVMLITYQGKLAVIEGISHELAHQLEAGRNFDLRLRSSSDGEANDHEASALRIEVAALAILGVRVSLRHLWHDANWRSERPAMTRANRILSDRERRCAAVFTCIVRDTIRGNADRLAGPHPGDNNP